MENWTYNMHPPVKEEVYDMYPDNYWFPKTLKGFHIHLNACFDYSDFREDRFNHYVQVFHEHFV